MYAAMSWVIFGSGEALLPTLCQAFIWANVTYSQLDPKKQKYIGKPVC